jgi:outer membrane immunogenic protein
MRKGCSAALGLLAAMIVPVAAGAAELPVKAPPPPPPPAFSWTGFYFGGEIGGAWSTGHVTDDLLGIDFSTQHSGWIGGFDVGYNYQINNIVLGVEGNLDWTSIRDSATFVLVPGTFTASAHTDWVDTVTGRIGVAFNPFWSTNQTWSTNQAMIYVKGGGAWVRNSASIFDDTTGVGISAFNTNDGWVAGAGVEWAFDPRWSVKLEYDYIGLNHWNFSGLTLVPGDTFSVSRDIEELKIGINYRFDFGSQTTGSVATRY